MSDNANRRDFLKATSAGLAAATAAGGRTGRFR